MAASEYAELLEKARADLAIASSERNRWDMQVARLQRTVLALSALVEQPTVDPSMGITEGIKAILRDENPNGLFPTTLRIRLERSGFDFSNSINPLAAIHSILKRLINKGLVEGLDRNGKTAYFWKQDREGDLPHEYLKTFMSKEALERARLMAEEQLLPRPETPVITGTVVAQPKQLKGKKAVGKERTAK